MGSIRIPVCRLTWVTLEGEQRTDQVYFSGNRLVADSALGILDPQWILQSDHGGVEWSSEQVRQWFYDNLHSFESDEPQPESYVPPQRTWESPPQQDQPFFESVEKQQQFVTIIVVIAVIAGVLSCLGFQLVRG